MIGIDRRNINLLNDGQSRPARKSDALDPLFAKIDNRTVADILEFACHYAKKLKFFDTQNAEDGDWRTFFDNLSQETIKAAETNGDLKPHAALFVAFLHILQYAQNQLNDIGKRHIDFYYQNVLKLTKKPLCADTVHVLFTLKKGLDNHILKEGTILSAGEDAEGKALFYKLINELVVQQASVSALHSIYLHQTEDGEKVRYARKADSIDGIEEELDPDDPQWYAFGHEDLPEAETGCAVASPILMLSEGTRKITVELDLIPPRDTELLNEIGTYFLVYYTGEEGWVGPKTASDASDSQSDGYHATFSIDLDPDDPPFVKYDSAIHGGEFDTSLPLMKMIFNGASNNSYNILKRFVIKTIKISVDVNDIVNLTIENDEGPLNPLKPFLPFGAVPIKGSRFYIGYPEAFSKKLDSFSLDITWGNVPEESLKDHYSAYTALMDNVNEISTSKGYFIADLISYDDTRKKATLFNDTAPTNPVNISSSSENSKFSDPVNLKENFICLRLKKSFLHEVYRKLYPQKVMEYAKEGGELTIPNEPYTPLITSCTLNYESTTETVDLSLIENSTYQADEISFFHITPFGQRRRHAFLKPDSSKPRTPTLIPAYTNEGEFFIGLNNAEPLQNLSLLFQVAEGSADLEIESDKIEWCALSDNRWQSLKDSEKVSDTSNGFLTSGIVTLTIPKEATDNNTLMPKGSFWIRASIKKGTKGVSKFRSVHTNAAAASCIDDNGKAKYQGFSLPAGTIKKLSPKDGQIKSVSQPYASFNGRLEEDNTQFYIRVSERLRHKDRSNSLWDYERLVLEAFPSVYKVKCLCHTSAESGYAPGHVRIIVIPLLTNQNAVNPLQPIVSKNTLKNIEEFLVDRSSMFVRIGAENPEYEKITLEFQVNFKEGYDPGYYKTQCNEDLKKFLSPWAYNPEEEISFGGSIHKSVVIAAIEKFEYIDFVNNVKMYHGALTNDIDIVRASTPEAILVSSSQHNIETITT